ncbi:ribosomal RNA-processing protein 7 homolog A-like [Watersipora subatra]|uniref:ribosomal RNA-processing protein 7 homolog A-like n=1 Tax=Watersipora subatra TaxID=2589382 RepID=UPI00355B579D
MTGTVTVGGITVILVKFKKKTSVELNWWLSKGLQPHSLRVTGIPLYAHESCVRRVFSQCGEIRSVSLQPSSGDHKKSHLPQSHTTMGYQQAMVTFKKLSAQKKALAMKYNDDYTLYDEDAEIKPITEVWTKDLLSSYDINTQKLEQACVHYMKSYDNRKEKEERVNRKLADEPDEDGWITVTRNKFSRPPKAVKAHELKTFKKKKETATLLHFYKNQINDSKMQRIKELKAKFEEDKKRIQEMRQQRKFKPY